MKKKSRLILSVIVFLILIIVMASIIKDILYLLIKDKINPYILFLIQATLLFIMIELLFRTEAGKELDKQLFRKK